MANTRIPRFIMEVAPPQFVTVMRSRTRKMLDTISEEDRDGSYDSLSPTSRSSPTSVPVGAIAAAASSSSSAAAASSSSSSSAAAAATVTANSKFFLRGVSSYSIFEN